MTDTERTYESSDDDRRPLRVSDLNVDERPREKAMRAGVSSLTDVELLAIILSSGVHGMSVIDLSRKILGDCGNKLGELARMTPAQLCTKYKGIGHAKAVHLAAAIELGVRCRERSGVGDRRIASSADVAAEMAGLIHLSHEEFWVLLLSRSNKVRHRLRISAGGTAATVVDVKMVMKEAVDRLAESLILVHNHPSGRMEPSAEDDKLTRRLADAARVLEIKLLDHVIVGSGGHYSYADQGRMP